MATMKTLAQLMSEGAAALDASVEHAELFLGKDAEMLYMQKMALKDAGFNDDEAMSIMITRIAATS